jgi:methionine--tRNA ligase beta chain
MKDLVTIEDLAKLDLRIGTILSAARVEGSDKLLRLELDLGESNAPGEKALRQLVSGIGKTYSPEDLIGTQVLIIANLAPRVLLGLESRGMLLASENEEGVVLLTPNRPIAPGSALY